MWIEGVTKAKEFVKAFMTEISSVEGITVVYPTGGEIVNKAIAKIVTSFGKTFYLMVEKGEDTYNHVMCQIGTNLNETGDDFADGKCSEKARFAWYIENPNLFIGDWLPVQYWMKVEKDSINVVVQGDPTTDQAPYNNYLISYGYFGTVDGYEGADADTDYNFAMTVSSDIAVKNYSTKFGLNTGTGVTDIVMVGTRTGAPYQRHNPAFHTANPFMDKNFISSSAWTHKYHASDITVVHAYDRERGKLKNVLAMDKSAVFHQDELVMDKGKETEKTYKFFNINAPYSLFENSANVLYGLALRKK